MTKEELIAQVATLKEDRINLKMQDEKLREEFSKAFSWKKESSYYQNSTEYKIPTWEEIFVKIGKLLASDNFNKLAVTIDSLQIAVEDIYKKLSENKEV